MTPGLTIYLVTYRHAEENHVLYRNILAGQSGALFSRRIREYFATLILDGLKDYPQQTGSIPPEVLANYIAGAELAMFTWWLENDRPYAPEQMAQMVHRRR